VPFGKMRAAYDQTTLLSSESRLFGTTSIRTPGLPTSSDEYSTIQQSGSIFYRGSGTQNHVLPPDKLFRIETGEPIGLPRRALIDLGQLNCAAGRPMHFRRSTLAAVVKIQIQ
jgi:hypothetical protein